MTKIRDLANYLESIAPPVYQESYDNVGLIVGDPDSTLKGVLVCLDSTEAIVEEAIQKKCNLIVAHHPIVFRGLKRFNGENYVERVVIKAIRHNIAIYAIHTNLDNVYHQGVNARIAERLGLMDTRLLAPKAPEEGKAASVGSGMLGRLPKPMTESAFLEHLKMRMKVNCIRHTSLLGQEVDRVALCGGSGGFLLGQAKAAGAQFFITADYKYHEFFDADGQLVIADIGHYESEQFTIDLLHEVISQKFSNFAAYSTAVVTNPVHYYF